LTHDLFDREFAAVVDSPWLREAFGDLPPEVDPFSFVTLDGLHEIVAALALAGAPNATIVDIACGRGGPGLWVAHESGAALIGVDFSPVGIEHAIARAARYAPDVDARYFVADAAATGLPDASADGLICVDAIQLMWHQEAVIAEASRVLRPGGRAVFTTWEDDERLPDLAARFESNGLRVVAVEERPEWMERERRIFERARAERGTCDDPGLRDLAEEAEVALPLFDRTRRVIGTAERP
jgi:SAM-dependent methyltransferase